MQVITGKIARIAVHLALYSIKTSNILSKSVSIANTKEVEHEHEEVSHKDRNDREA